MMKGPKRRWLIPEVIQTSAMDCGPATLKALLEAFGMNVSYGRLREACQTDVDGTSIDVIEETACRLGLKAQQVMLPAEHVLLDQPAALPAIVVINLPGGDTHFVIAWRRVGSYVQLMDPALGRHWVKEQRFLADLHRHNYDVVAEDWRAWAGSEDFLQGLKQRIGKVGGDMREAAALINLATTDANWFSLAALDAAIRMTEALQRSGAIRDPSARVRMLQAIYAEACKNPTGQVIPANYWSVLPQASDTGVEQLTMRGAVLVTISGLGEAEPAEALSPDLAAALTEKPQRAFGYFWQLLKEIGLGSPLLLGFAILLGVGMVMVEALLFRGLLDLVRDFETAGQRLTGILSVALLALVLLLIEFSNIRELQRQGRQLEIRLRQAFLHKIPRLNDRYFHSRTISDMAERAHHVHRLRGLPAWSGQLLRAFAELSFTVAGIIWLDPQLTLLAICSGLLALGIPLLAQPALNERDLRARSHEGALSRFYLEAMLGLSAVRAHCAERAVRSQHEGLLSEWARASTATLRLSLLIEGIQALVCLTLIIMLLNLHYAHAGDSGSFLLLIYWALKLPMLGQQLAALFRRFPAHRNTALRFMEPLGARDETETVATPLPDHDTETASAASVPKAGATVTLHGVTAQAAGHDVLRGLDVHISAGTQLAIVGASGAGKSSLVGLLLGWMQPLSGEIRIDGEPLTAQRLRELRRETAWLDPAIQLWNASLLNNLMYGHDASMMNALGKTLVAADLHGVLKHCPSGLQTQLGESGAFLSGGEGQRVRLGRSLLRQSARLVILDEPFRGLNRTQRVQQMQRVRAAWPQATLLCVTHDVSETLLFERVLVMEGGKIVEDAAPAVLAADENSRFHALLTTEETLQQSLWADPAWQRLWMEDGQLRSFNAEPK